MVRDVLRRASPQTEAGSARGWVFDVKRFAVHDGPGIRTTVFLKGCSLRCEWCHNPEAISPTPEVFFYPERCIACGACVTACPNGAQLLAAGGERTYDRDACGLSGHCVETCCSNALVMAGKRLSVDDVMGEVLEDATFYRVSGGGVTLSGGEPLLQAEFATALLRSCRREGLHTAVDTCGHIPWRFFERALPDVDLVLYDLKHISPRLHKQYTGVSNKRVIENLHRLRDYGVPVEVRMLIVPTINDSREFIEPAAELLASLDNITAVRLLAYHRFAGSKYRNLGRSNTMPDVAMPAQRQMQDIAGWIGGHGLKVMVPDSV